ncbi:hypothetical protein ACTMU2_33605 [Cupriavidus basilensis]
MLAGVTPNALRIVRADGSVDEAATNALIGQLKSNPRSGLHRGFGQRRHSHALHQAGQGPWADWPGDLHRCGRGDLDCDGREQVPPLLGP